MDTEKAAETTEISSSAITRETTDSTPRRFQKRSSVLGSQLYRPVLICLSGIHRGQRKRLTTERLIVGRSQQADWQIDDPAASRLHFQINYSNCARSHEIPECSVLDLDSRNGTEVNGVTIKQETVLKERDRIVIGTTVIGWFIRDEAELRHDDSLYFSATSDVLTGLQNRRQLRSQLDQEFARSKRHKHPISFLLLDLDCFKNINDEYGHDIGDDALCHIAKLLRNSCRESDLIARWGGEEFALCLLDTSAEKAEILAERIRDAVQKTPLNIGDEQIRMTASIGGTAYVPGDTFESMFQRADKMLYNAKDAGRNRVQFG